MRLRPALSVLSLPLLVAALACSSSDDDDSAAAGSSGSSGHPQAGSGGSGGSGGTGGSGGSGGSAAGSAGQTAGGAAGAPAAKGLTLSAAGADPSACTFAQTLGQPAATCVVTLTNQGTKTITFPSAPVTITGGDAALFTVATPPTGTLAAGASTTMTVTFTPGDEGARTATLAVASDSAVKAPPLALKGMGACPTKPPVDLTVPVIRDHCTQTLFIGVGDRTRRLVSTDLTTWAHDQLDHTGCLDNGDGTLNCGGDATFDCSKKDPKECKDLGLGGLDCSVPDPGDPKKTQCNGFDDSAFNAAFGLGLIVVASDFGIFTSADAGATWTKAPAPAPQQWNQGSHVGKMAFGNGRFVSANKNNTYTSTDGYTWEHTTDELQGGYYGFGDFAFGGGHFVAAGEKKTKVTEDGKTWHDPTDIEINRLAYGNGVFVGAGNGFRATSPDGTNWQKVNDVCPATPDDVFNWKGAPADCIGNANGAIWDGKRFVVCGTNCVESPDGKTWTLMANLHFAYGLPFYYFHFADGLFLASGNGTAVSSSPDLMTWTGHDFPTDTVGTGRYVQNVSTGLVLKPAKTP